MEAAEIANDDKRARLLETKRQQEKVRKAHTEVRFALEKTQANSVLSVDIPSPNNPNETITLHDKSEIEKAVMTDHKIKFQQVWDTPFMLQPLYDMLGPLGLNPAAEEILHGTFKIPEDLDEDTKTVIKHMKMDESILQNGAIRNGCTTKEFQQFWKKPREKISSSLSGLHNGHYIAAAQDTYLSRLTATLSSLPWQMGVPTRRWTTSLIVEIEKRSGERRLDKLRTIHLLEADFNTGTKLIFNKRMLGNARTHNLIPDPQYQRKGSRSVEAVIFKKLFFDLLRLQQRPGSVVSNDLRSCFDRIPHPVGSIACRRLGVNPQAITTLFTTLQQMKYFVRTGYGDSETYYTGDDDKPLQGGGQGNGAAGPLWIAISLILISIMSEFEIQSKCMAAISGIYLIFSVIMYVDDSDLLLLGDEDDEYDDILRKTQALANKWSNTLWSLGSALRPEKCFWFPILFEWDECGNYRY